jgi:hypothetical protein
MLPLSSRVPCLLLAFGVLLVGLLAPSRALAWAPMCDLTASTVIAPMVAPPVESGEIRAGDFSSCPLVVDDDGAHPSLFSANTEDGNLPQPPNQDSTQAHALRYSLSTTFAVSIARGSLVLVLPSGDYLGEPRAGFTRELERPPCL